MANFHYAHSRATAERLIAKFGMTGTIRRYVSSGPSYDPVNTPENYPCQLVVLEYADANIDGTLILATDKQLYVSTAGLGISLLQSDKVVVGEVEYSIQRLKPLRPAGIIVYWEVQGRR